MASPARGHSPSQPNTNAFIGASCLLALVLGTICVQLFGPITEWRALIVLAVLGALAWWLPATSSDGRSHFTADNIVVLAAIPIVGAVGAGVVGLVMATLTRRRIPVRRRIFNVAMTSSAAMAGGLAYAALGGSGTVKQLHGFGTLTWQVGIPIVLADATNLLVNAVLVAGVIRFSQGVPFRLQLSDMLTSSGPTQFAYGVIAFILVVLWQPGGLDEVAVLVVLAPLLGARWALLQYGEERDARERALGALVAAIETRAPSLEGHSARVSELAALMAQDLGLGPQEVNDVRIAGLLHDLGRVVVAPGAQRAEEAATAAERGAAMLRDLPILAGASRIIAEVARLEDRPDTVSIAADVVKVADDYDLMRHSEDPVHTDDALARLRDRPHGDDRVIAALARALSLRIDLPSEVADAR